MYRGGVETPSESLSADIGKDWGALTSLHIWMWTSSITSAFGIVHFLRFLTYRFPSRMCKHLSLKNPEVQFKTKRESNECLSFWKNKLLNLRIWIRARLFWKKMPSSISGTPLNAQERSWPLSLLSAWCLISWQDRSSAALQKRWAVIAELGVNYSVSVTFFWRRLTKWVALCDSEYLTSRLIRLIPHHDSVTASQCNQVSTRGVSWFTLI